MAETPDNRIERIENEGLVELLGKMLFAPISMLGCMATATGCFSRDSFEKSLYEVLPERKHKLIPTNVAAFDKGAEYAK